jgi:hypothetical protein
MELNINNLVRSGVVLALGLPLMLPLGSAIGRATQVTQPSAGQEAATTFKDDLTVPCLRFAFSREDTKAEREAKNDIDEVLGGDANHSAVCNYVL